MTKPRTAWHLLAATLLEERKPQAVTLETEVPLSHYPEKVDLLLLRKDDRPIDDATAFHGLWQRMGPTALVEYKSRARPPRPGVLHQLMGYGHQFARMRQADQPADQLSLFLLAATVTRTVERDIALLRYELGPSEGAYIPFIGPPFPTWIVPLNTLAEEEGEPLIGELGSRKVTNADLKSLRWLARFFMTNQDNALHLEGFEELKADFMKSEAFHEMAQEYFLEGRREGEREGRLEGRLEGEAAMLMRLLARRFGEVPEDVQARVRGANSEQILRWADRVLDAPTLAAVFAKDS